MNICEHLTATARLVPNRDALIFEGRGYSYEQLDALSAAAARQLREAGIERGDRVALHLPNIPAFVVWYYAALRVGAVAASISTRLADKEVAELLADCQAKALVRLASHEGSKQTPVNDCVDVQFDVNDAGNQLRGRELQTDSAVNDHWVDMEPDDPAVVLYTSGTTGQAKGATLSHSNVRSNACAFNHLCRQDAEDRILLAVPLFHCFGQNALMNSGLNVGAALLLQRKFDPQEISRLLLQQRITQLYGVPAMYQMLHETCEPADLQTVNYCFSAAAKLPIQVSQRWEAKFGLPIHEGYGLTETSPFASYNHRTRHRPGSIGTPIDGVEMKIVDPETDQPCPPGELGEIAIRGPNVMLGYWNRPKETARAVREGWFYSGDIGKTDEQGFFYVVDRVKDMIVVAGLKVYPAEVERVLLDHPGVAEVAVVGFLDEVVSEKVVAFVVAREKTEPDQLAADVLRFARSRLASYKVPAHVECTAQLPRNASGKVLKTELRARPLRLFGSDGALDGSEPILPVQEPALRSELEAVHPASRGRAAQAYLQALVQAISGDTALPDIDARLLDAGLDSLMLLQLSTQLQCEVGAAAEIPATIAFDYPTIEDLAKHMVALFEPAEAESASPSRPASSPSNWRKQIETLSEEEALSELMREIKD